MLRAAGPDLSLAVSLTSGPARGRGFPMLSGLFVLSPGPSDLSLLDRCAAGSVCIGRVGWLCYMCCGAERGEHEWHQTLCYPFPSGPA
jgi:hypothetical protein